jgi:hypothetical protein
MIGAPQDVQERYLEIGRNHEQAISERFVGCGFDGVKQVLVYLCGFEGDVSE